jgi:hypothetical protein
MVGYAALSAPTRMGLSDIAEEFRDLDDRRRHQGLSLSEAERYHDLFARLSDALASGERHRRVDMRQFLRIRFPMQLVVKVNGREILAPCEDFGGGGCDIRIDHAYRIGEELLLDGAIIQGVRHPLHGRANIVWMSLPFVGSTPGYGLRFVLDSPKMRDQVDRLLYRVLDTFLKEPVTHDAPPPVNVVPRYQPHTQHHHAHR